MDELDEKVKRTIEKLKGDFRVDSERLMEWVNQRVSEAKFNPSSYLLSVLQRIKAEHGNLYYYFAKEGMTPQIAKEIKEEEKVIKEELELRKEYPDFWKQEWTEPFDKRFERSPSVFDGIYAGHDEYREFTFIEVKRRADEQGTSMHEICRRHGLEFEMLIF